MLDFLTNNIWLLLLMVNYLLVIIVAFAILLKNINPTKTVSYIIVLVFFPFFGLVVYYLFGQEYRKDKIFNRKNILNQTIITEVNEQLAPQTKEIKELENNLLEERIKLVKLLMKSSRNSPLTTYNDLEIIINGENKFKLLLEDLKNAQDH
ncbi:MAG TPA: PLDc N-terminal domain-containing protein, partial [Aquaticitalea sp.]|nr:PLDc N-terminal domain-containing protein [Aquaticitalea sp.]